MPMKNPVHPGALAKAHLDELTLRNPVHPGALAKANLDELNLRNPVHPGALAKANLDELNLSVAAAAKTMKITRQQLHNVMQGRSAVTPEMALRFEKAFGGNADSIFQSVNEPGNEL